MARLTGRRPSEREPMMKLIPDRLRRRSEPDHDGSMSLVDHLTELRYRLLVSIVAIGVGALVGWFLFDWVLDLLLDPYCDYLETVPPKARVTQDCALFFSGALEPLIIKLKLVGFLGLFIALPVVLYELWAFIVPGLTRRERRMGIPFVLCSMALFILGALIAYWTLPRALGFLLGFAGPQFAALLTADKFLSFVMLVALSFGLAFELPIVLSFLLAVGAVSTRQLRDWRRGAILFIAVFAAIITPSSDPYTMLAMTIPMVLFYEAAIIVGRLMKR
jgi:sec-independent protein translocase protein TatC